LDNLARAGNFSLVSGDNTDMSITLRPFVAASLVASLVLLTPSSGLAADEGADIALALSAPDAPAVGTSFDYVLTVTNKGPETARNVAVTDALPAEVDYVSAAWEQALGSCSYTSEEYPPAEPKSDGTETGAGPGEGSTAPEYYRYHHIDCLWESLAPGKQTTVTITVSRTSAWPIYNGAWVTSSSSDPNWENDYAEAYADADPSVTANLSLAASAPTSVPAGDEFDYPLEVANTGPATATDVVLNSFLGEGLEYVSSDSSDPTDSCALEAQPPGSEGFARPTYHTLNCELGDLTVGEEAAITIRVRRIGAREIYASTWVYGSSYDPDYADDYADLILPADTSNPADLSVTKSVSDKSPAVGAGFDYTITVTNEGPASVDGVYLSDYLPYEVDFVSVTPSDPQDDCEFQDYGYYGDELPAESTQPTRRFGEVNCDLGALGSGDSATVTITVTRASAWPIYNSAWITSASYDPNYDNDYAETSIEADRSATADVGISKSAPKTPAAGEQFDYTLTVTNDGPATADAVVVNDYFPEGVEYIASSSSDAADTCAYEPYPGPEPLRPKSDGDSYPAYYGFYCELGGVEPGEQTTITLTVRRTEPQALYNSGWVSTTSYDPNWDNNYSDVCTEGESPPPPETQPEDDEVNSGGGKVDTGAGNDSIYVTTCGDSRDVTVESGKGGDNIEVNVDAAESLRNVRINGGPGRDRISVSIGTEAVDVVIVITAGRGNDEVTITAPPDASITRIVVRGGRGNDVLTGGPLADLLRGQRGSDLLIGGDGDDTLFGGPGKDTCRPGPGTNSVRC
jgi:uncharacterized repeat protein (TIGR01451 family)